MILQPQIEWRPWCNLEALYLGEIIVGRVAATGGGRNGTKARAMFNLAAVDRVAYWVDCRDLSAAKLEIETRLADWLKRAGLQ